MLSTLASNFIDSNTFFKKIFDLCQRFRGLVFVILFVLFQTCRRFALLKVRNLA